MSEWGSERLDLTAYLDRIGYAGPLEPTGAVLTALHRAHLTAVPFENLDILFGRGVSVDLDTVQAKLVGRRRGGYCHEHGVLFGAVLERLGYRVERLLARVGDVRGRLRPRTHLALHVWSHDGEWLADVGFGAGLLEPLPWDAPGPHRQGGWTFELAAGADQTRQLRERPGEQWHTLYSFSPHSQHASDVEMANHFTATHPTSPFTRQLIVMGKSDRGRRRLLGRTLSLVRPDGTAVESMLGDGQVGAALEEHFGLQVTGPELSVLLARLPAAADTRDPRASEPASA